MVLAPTPVWLPTDVDDEAARAATADLRGLGLLDRRGRVDPEVTASLAVLSRPRVEFYGWFHEGDRTIGVLAGAIGREAVLAVSDDETVWLSKSHVDRLADAVVAQTPDVPAGRGEAVTVLRSEAVAAGATADGFGRRTPSPQVRLTHRIAALPKSGTGELHVAVRDDMGRRRQAPQPLCYVDTPHGRWLTQRLPSGSDEQLTLAPGSRAALASMLARMHRDLTR